jgi:hypothetical protein
MAMGFSMCFAKNIRFEGGAFQQKRVDGKRVSGTKVTAAGNYNPLPPSSSSSSLPLEDEIDF